MGGRWGSRALARATVLSLLALGACSSDPTIGRILVPNDAARGFISRTGSNVAKLEVLTVCKYYVNADVLPAQTDFTLTVNATTYNFQLAPGECREVWEQGGAVATPDQVTVTETVPPGFTATYQVTTIDKNGSSTGAVTDGNSTTVQIGSAPNYGALVVFTNTAIPVEEPGVGRMTGGGFKVGDVKVTGGFTLHCDITLSNNLEINWDKNKWHLDKPITKAQCIDDPAIEPPPPAAPFDTFIGEGYGRLNGEDGSFIKFTLVDAGEPGTNDMVKLEIWSAGGTKVLDLPLSKLDIGNIQAHFDQPHRDK